MIKELIDLVGGLPQVKRGIVEGLIVTAYLAAVYCAWKGGYEEHLIILSVGILIGVATVAVILIIKNKGEY